MIMMGSYSDHAANERTFLAWVRTGIAIMSFGIVVEKFDLFIRALAVSGSPDAVRRVQLDRLSGVLGRHDSVALIIVGLALVTIQTVRFVRTSRLLDDAQPRAARAVRNDSIVSAVLVLLVTAIATYSMFD